MIRSFSPALFAFLTLLAPQLPAQSSPPETQEQGQAVRPVEGKRKDPGFLRIHRDKAKRPVAMQTAIARYGVAEGEKGRLVVDLIAAVHVGDRDYYEKLNIKFEQYDVLLYELVAPEGQEVPERGRSEADNPIAWLQKMASGALGLTSQLAHIDYTKENFVHADLSPSQMAEAMRKRGDNGLTVALGVVADMMRQTNRQLLEQEQNPQGALPFEDLDPLSLLIDPGGGAKFKVIMAEQLVTQMSGTGLGRTLETILVDDRNAAAMKKFQKALTQGHRRIGIFYGAAHMPDFDRRLRQDFGLERKRVDWLTAWNLKASPNDTGLGSMLKILGDELAGDLREGK